MLNSMPKEHKSSYNNIRQMFLINMSVKNLIIYRECLYGVMIQNEYGSKRWLRVRLYNTLQVHMLQGKWHMGFVVSYKYMIYSKA
jgi:hypothetical protein